MNILWFIAGFLFLVPGSFAHPASGLVIEPYWFYVSSMGFFILAAMVLISFKQRIGNILSTILIAVVCLALFTLTQRFNVIAKTQKSYSQYWLSISLNTTPLTALAKTAYLENDYALAAHYYELYLQRFSASPYSKDPPDAVYTTLGAIYLDMGNFALARDRIIQAIRINPANPRPYIVDGMIDVKEKKYDLAQVHFLRAIEIDPQNILARYHLVDLYVATKQYEKAIRVLDELLGMNMGDQERAQVLAKLSALKKIKSNE